MFVLAWMQNLCTQGPQNPAKEKEDMLRNSENHRGMDLEELLNRKLLQGKYLVFQSRI